MNHIKDVVCCPERHLALLIALAVIMPGVWTVADDVRWDGWRKTRLLRCIAATYAGMLFAIARMWRTVVGLVVGTYVVYLLLVARERWCESGGACASASASEAAPKPNAQANAWPYDPCDFVVKRKERRACQRDASPR